MKFLPRILSLLTVAAALELLPETFIQNHNVNVILNVDAKEIANELWKVIESHLNYTEDATKSRRMFEKSAVNELERLVRRYVQPSRRLGPLAEFELAQNFEKIVQKTASQNIGQVGDIVDDMMRVTKNMMRKKKRVVDEKTQTANPGVKRFGHILQHVTKSLKSIEKGVKEFAKLIEKTDTADSSIGRSMDRENRRAFKGYDCDVDAN